MTIRQAILDRQGLQQTTVASYLKFLEPVLDKSLTDPTVVDWVETIGNPNTRRSCVIALRAAGYTHNGNKIKTPKGYPRRYDLPDEEDLLIMFSYSKYEVQYLSMTYLGLRLGEACIVNKHQLMPGNQIIIDRQVAEWRHEGKRCTAIRQPKSRDAVIDILD